MINSVGWKMINYADSAKIIASIMELLVEPLSRLRLNVFINFFNYLTFWQNQASDTIENTTKYDENTKKYNWPHNQM